MKPPVSNIKQIIYQFSAYDVDLYTFFVSKNSILFFKIDELVLMGDLLLDIIFHFFRVKHGTSCEGKNQEEILMICV